MRMKKFLLSFFILFLLSSGVYAAVTGNAYDYSEANEALSYIQNFLKSKPETAIITGSGLGEIAEIITDKIIIDTKNIPNWPLYTAPGHEGKLIAGTIEGRNAIIFQGRVHYYEGHSMKAVTFAARVAGMLGVKEIIITNASGAINESYKAGDIIAVRDHINFMGNNPLIGKDEPRWNERFPDMSKAYDKKMLSFLSSMGLNQGVYAAFTGPSYQTLAETRMARLLGADLAGMSTVPEVIAASAMGMRVAVLSCVADIAPDVQPDKILTGQEVLEVMNKSSHELSRIITELIKYLNQNQE